MIESESFVFHSFDKALSLDKCVTRGCGIERDSRLGRNVEFRSYVHGIHSLLGDDCARDLMSGDEVARWSVRNYKCAAAERGVGATAIAGHVHSPAHRKSRPIDGSRAFHAEFIDDPEICPIMYGEKVESAFS